MRGSNTFKACLVGRILCCQLFRKTSYPKKREITIAHKASIVLYIKSCTYNQKTSAHHNSLHFHIQIHWEINSKEISIGEHLSCQSRPLFGDLSHLGSIDSRYLNIKNIRISRVSANKKNFTHLKFDVATHRKRTKRSFDSHNCVTSSILNGECWTKD